MSPLARGRNCAGCGRWRPGFADRCVDCGEPSPARLLENLAAYLSGDDGHTRPADRVSETYHGPPRKRRGAEEKVARPALMALLVRGFSVPRAAKQVGVSRRRAYRWVAESAS